MLNVIEKKRSINSKVTDTKSIFMYPTYSVIDVEINVDDINMLPIDIRVNLEVKENDDIRELDRYRLTNRMVMREKDSQYYIRINSSPVDSILYPINIDVDIIRNFIKMMVNEESVDAIIGQLEADGLVNNHKVNISVLHGVINIIKYIAIGVRIGNGSL
jgi:hypothetical protein